MANPLVRDLAAVEEWQEPSGSYGDSPRLRTIFMTSGDTKRKIAENVLGTAVGAAIAGPAGGVAGGFVGSYVTTHVPHPAETKRAPKKGEQVDDDPIVHPPLKRTLAPLDFSLSSRAALRFARGTAGGMPSKLIGYFSDDKPKQDTRPDA